MNLKLADSIDENLSHIHPSTSHLSTNPILLVFMISCMSAMALGEFSKNIVDSGMDFKTPARSYKGL